MEVLLDDHVLHRVHGCFQQRRVGSIGVVNVDFSIRDSVDSAESIGEIPGGGIKVVIRAAEIGEVLGDGGDVEFSFEEIDFVQEQDNGFSLEPFAVDQRLEEHHCLVHLVLKTLVSLPPLQGARGGVPEHLPHFGLQLNTGRTLIKRP